MTMVDSRPLHTADEVEAHIRAICFKTGPPARIGAELEWTLHHTAAPRAPLDAAVVTEALGPYAPATLCPGRPEPPSLAGGGQLTAEPGGQLEISSAPATGLAALHTAVSADLRQLRRMLARSGLQLGDHGIDPHRAPRRLLHTPRYAAMEHGFDRRGPHGRTMMCSTAGLQVCLDAGTADQLRLRWAAANALGPLLLAAFATSARQAGRDTGWASARMATWWGIDPRRSHPVRGDDPAAAWIAYAMTAPLLCLRRPGGDWRAPPGVTVRDWVDGKLGARPTADDLDYHLSTLFPPVRPRGYLEIRYLDAQPGDAWITPVAVLAGLFGDDDTTAAALEIAAPTADEWIRAARHGLTDPVLRHGATAVLDLACRRIEESDLPAPLSAQVTDSIGRLLADAGHTDT